MIHLDLFSGIGGFALAVDEVFPGTEHIFCEIDLYCQQLLKRRFPGSVIYGDIRQLGLNPNSNGNGCSIGEQKINSTNEREQTLNDAKECCGRVAADAYFWGLERAEAKGRDSVNVVREDNVGILTGGFPCQPFSQAGKRKGTSDNRYLWPQMLRVIREFKPTWVIAENVRGLLTIEQGVVFQQVCLDLEGEGYEVQPFIIPAVAVNAPHRRDRVWFVANRRSGRCGRWLPEQSGRNDQQQVYPPQEEQTRYDLRSEIVGCGRSNRQDAPDTESRQPREQTEWKGGQDFSRRNWETNWLEVATELCGVDDGLPAELDGLKLSKSRHRVERLKALGNAIVPQVAVEILKAIKETL